MIPMIAGTIKRKERDIVASGDRWMRLESWTYSLWNGYCMARAHCIESILSMYYALGYHLHSQPCPNTVAMHSNNLGTSLCRLQNLWRRRRKKLGTKYSIPKPASDAEPILVVHEVMLKMIFLELTVMQW